MGENKKEGRVKISWIFFIKFCLGSKIIPRVIEGMDFINPERLVIKGIEPQGEPDHQTKNKYENVFSF